MKPAHPSYVYERDTRGDVVRMVPRGGMSLRDYFAGKALSAFVRSFKHEQYHGWHGNAGVIAEKSYALADAMLAARKARRP